MRIGGTDTAAPVPPLQPTYLLPTGPIQPALSLPEPAACALCAALSLFSLFEFTVSKPVAAIECGAEIL
jgi:hypothetical protein